MNYKSFSLAVLTSVILSLSGCDHFSVQTSAEKPQKASKAPQRPPHAVEIISVSTQAVRIKRTLTGTLEAPRTVHIHSEQAGRIIELPYFEGDRVNKGDVIARLDDTLLRAGLAKVVATRKQAELDIKRLQKLVPQKLATEDELARAGTSLELARAEESLQRTLLSRTVIKAPFDGLISERLREPSDVVALNEHMLTLYDPDFMSAAVQVPEHLHSRLNTGDPVKVRIDSLGDRRFDAKILRIHPAVDPATRLGTVEIHLDPVPNAAHPGQLCRITLETSETPRRLIPLNALQFDAAGSYVYRLDEDSKANRTEVSIGLQIGEFIEIIEGVNDGDLIVSRGFLGLKSGKTVKVVNPDKQSVTGS